MKIECSVCKKEKFHRNVTRLPNNQKICDSCFDIGMEKLDFEDPSNIDKNTMEKAIELTKKKRLKNE